MSRPNLLALAKIGAWPEPNGYSLRVRHLLSQLTQWWDVTLVALQYTCVGKYQLPGGIRDVISIPVEDPRSFLPAPYERNRLRDTVDQIRRQRRPSVALLWSGTEFLAFNRKDFPPTVGDRIDCATLTSWRDCLHLPGLRQRLSEMRSLLKFARYEQRVVRAMAYTIVVGEEDAQVLRRLSGRDTIRVVPNGVAVGPWPVWDQEAQVPTVIFTGVMSYWPNIDAVHHFARKIWPDVRAAIPNARFLIAGRSPDPSVTRLGQRPGVEVLADVPDMAAVLRKAWLAVAPMRCGSGIKNKVLEAWAAGKPVVMSKLASNGLRLDAPAARLVAAGPQEMGRLVMGLLSSQEERERLGAAGYSLVADRHSWDAAAQQLSTLLDAASRQGDRRFGQAGVRLNCEGRVLGR